MPLILLGPIGSAAAGAGGAAVAVTEAWYFFFREKEPDKHAKTH